MASFEVICITSTFTAAACRGLEWTVPVIVFLHILDHIFLLIVSPETILTEFFSVNNTNERVNTYVHEPTRYPL